MKITSESINQNTTKHHVLNDGHVLSFSAWIQAMLTSDELILEFNSTLIDSKFDAFFWEVKPVSLELINQDFEFVLVNSNALKGIAQNDTSFKNFFEENKAVVNFPNLRKDAELIVPTPISSQTKYAHIANFVRTADQNQIVDFWKKVVEVYSSKIGHEMKWLSTSGLGVYWLHVRVDSRPKYYQHLEYKL